LGRHKMAQYLLFPVGDCRAQVGVAVTPSGTSKGQGASLHEGLQKSPSISIILDGLFHHRLWQGSLFRSVEKRNKKDDNGEGEVNWPKSTKRIVSAFVWGRWFVTATTKQNIYGRRTSNLAGIENFRIVWRTSCDRRTSPSTAFAS
jgi:hypothetical protein